MGFNLHKKDPIVTEEEITHEQVLAMTARLIARVKPEDQKIFDDIIKMGDSKSLIGSMFATQYKYTKGDHKIPKGEYIVDDKNLLIGHCIKCGKVVFGADYWYKQSDHCKRCERKHV